jgi:hypothetical protein
MTDIRIDIREIKTCLECSHFKDNPHAHGCARYSCKHPNGPGGKLASGRKIHEECPLYKKESWRPRTLGS